MGVSEATHSPRQPTGQPSSPPRCKARVGCNWLRTTGPRVRPDRSVGPKKRSTKPLGAYSSEFGRFRGDALTEAADGAALLALAVQGHKRARRSHLGISPSGRVIELAPTLFAMHVLRDDLLDERPELLITVEACRSNTAFAEDQRGRVRGLVVVDPHIEWATSLQPLLRLGIACSVMARGPAAPATHLVRSFLRKTAGAHRPKHAVAAKV